jgi:hypothetical protein
MVTTTMINFVGFVANLLNRQQMAHRSASEKELLFLRLGVRKITDFIQYCDMSKNANKKPM